MRSSASRDSVAHTSLASFHEVWTHDFEFTVADGEHPRVVCLVARELRSGLTLRLWEDELAALAEPPYRVDRGVLFVAYFATAELSCHLALGWPLPERVLDLYVEFRNFRSGLSAPRIGGFSLLGALNFYGIQGIDTIEKEEMRKLALRGGPWTPDERRALLDYCASDVDALEKLLPRMLPDIDVPRAVLRGRYMRAVARMEHLGVPVDVASRQRIVERWDDIKDELIANIDSSYGVFEGRTFKAARFARWLNERGYAWPQLPSGSLALDDDTFRDMAKVYPTISPLRELRHTLSQLRLSDLAVGSDGRNRVMLSPFGSKTGRNQPSNSKFIFGPSVWLRSLIQPAPGWGLAYIDWSQQEFGIAGALSGDAAMVNAYISGDPYLTFAKQAGAAPANATKKTHGTVREQFKACVLAVQYGMGAKALAYRINQDEARARELLQLHRQVYPDYWRWSDAAVNHAMLRSSLHTVFGWTVHVDMESNPRSLANFPMQANGAEMLRLAICLATERGIRVCAPVHDALLIEAPLDGIDTAVEYTQRAMCEASAIVLDGFELRSDPKVIRYPDRYRDERGAAMWDRVQALLDATPGVSAGVSSSAVGMEDR